MPWDIRRRARSFSESERSPEKRDKNQATTPMPKQMPAILAGTMQSNGTPPLDVCLGAAAFARSDCGDKLNGLLRQNLEKNDRLLS